MSRALAPVDFTFGAIMFVLGALTLEAVAQGDWIGVTGFGVIALLLCARFALTAPDAQPDADDLPGTQAGCEAPSATSRNQTDGPR